MLLNIDTTFLQQEYMGEKLSHILTFVGIVLATLLLKKPVATLLARISGRLGAKFSYRQHKGTIGDILLKPMERLVQVVLYFIALNQLSHLLDSISVHQFLFSNRKEKLTVTLGDVADHVFLLIFIIFLTQVVTRFVDFFYYLRMGRAEQEKNQSQQQLLPLLKEISKLLVWSVSVFWILGSVFHVNVPALITGLGIGGVAIALAGKETVENFFAAFTLLSDKPFQTGETIRLGEIEGVVERIGFRSTRIRNGDGSATVIPNQNLVSQSLTNLSTRSTRGLKVVANIRYGITPADLNKIITEVKASLGQMPPVTAPITVTVENLDKETFQLVAAYHLPHPLAEEHNLATIKHDVNLKVFEIVSHYGKLGTIPTPGTE